MSVIRKINEERQAMHTAMFKELGVLFAFSKEQFESQKKECVTYVRCEYGMIVPKENIELLRQGFSRINSHVQQAFQSHVSMDEYIHYELGNHECFYTGEWSEIIEIVQEYYPACTSEDVHRVYLSNIQNH